MNDDLLRFWRPAVRPEAGSETRAEHATFWLRPWPHLALDCLTSPDQQ